MPLSRPRAIPLYGIMAYLAAAAFPAAVRARMMCSWSPSNRRLRFGGAVIANAGSSSF